MMNVLTFIVALISYTVLDMIWFQFSTPSYKKVVETIQGKEMKLKYLGFLAWVVMAIGMAVLVVPLAESVTDAMRLGAIYGLVLYGTFNGTNYALFQDWTFNISMIDTLWGIFVSAMVAAITKYMSS